MSSAQPHIAQLLDTRLLTKISLVGLAAVRHIMGMDAHRVWTELHRGKHRRFIRAYRVFLSFR